jgi:pimeloyl-ACP methyl ester carboxylesterase
LVTDLLGQQSGQANPLAVDNRVSVDSLNSLVKSYPDLFQWVTDGTAQGASRPIAFRVHQDRLNSQWSNYKLQLRRWLADRNQVGLYEVCGKCGWETVAAGQPTVMVLSGLHGDEQTAIDVAAAIHQRLKYPTCAFKYPNDAPLSESAQYLQQTLQQWHQQQPSRKVILVTHSMAGLVARCAIEQPANEAGLAVRQLIQICPPTHGSAFAEYAGVLEGAEQIGNLISGNSQRPILKSLLDGFNEAPQELQPGSPFLQQLNVRPRNPQVGYTILAGSAGLIDNGLAALGGQLLARLGNGTANRSVPRRLQALLDSPDFRAGTGDGVVSIESARLSGVTDFQVLPVNHLDWCKLDQPQGQKVLEAVVRSIQRGPVLQF